MFPGVFRPTSTCVNPETIARETTREVRNGKVFTEQHTGIKKGTRKKAHIREHGVKTSRLLGNELGGHLERGDCKINNSPGFSSVDRAIGAFNTQKKLIHEKRECSVPGCRSHKRRWVGGGVHNIS